MLDFNRRSFLKTSAVSLLIPQIITPAKTKTYIIDCNNLINRDAAIRLVQSSRAVLRRCKFLVRFQDRFIKTQCPHVIIKESKITWTGMKIKCFGKSSASFIRVFDDRKLLIADCKFSQPIYTFTGDTLNISYTINFHPKIKTL